MLLGNCRCVRRNASSKELLIKSSPLLPEEDLFYLFFHLPSPLTSCQTASFTCQKGPAGLSAWTESRASGRVSGRDRMIQRSCLQGIALCVLELFLCFQITRGDLLPSLFCSCLAPVPTSSAPLSRQVPLVSNSDSRSPVPSAPASISGPFDTFYDLDGTVTARFPPERFSKPTT